MLNLGAVAVVMLSGVQPGDAPAERKTVRLVYVRETGAEICPAEAQVRLAVTSRLGYDPFRRDAHDTLLARVAKSEAGLSASIELVDETGRPRGNRELSTQGEGCEEMARAIALSITIAIDPERLGLADAEPPREPLQDQPAAPPTEAATTAEPQSPAPIVTPPTPPARPRDDHVAEPPPTPRIQLGLGLAGVAMVGVAPTVAFGGALELQGSRGGAWSLGLGGRVLRSPADSVAAGTRLEVTLAAAELNGCLHHAVFEHCLVGLAGESWAGASGISRPASDSGAFGALGVRSGLVARVTPGFALFARLEVLAVLAPIHPQVDGSDVWAGSSVAGTLAAGGRASFW